MLKFSLIVLSKTDKQSTFNMNLECLNTFVESAKLANIDFEIILIESNTKSLYKYSFENFKIITPKTEFNFHKFLNIGVEHASGDFYILSNNDVVFKRNWLIEILKVAQNNPSIKSFSPYDVKSNRQPETQIKNNSFIQGYEIQKHLTGWCIIVHKSVFKTIKKLDERFGFYYADNDYAMQLQKYNFKHALVTKAIVEHLHGQSSNTNKNKNNFTLPKNTPKHMIKGNWTWVLENKKMLEGAILFHEKWGSMRLIKLKLAVAFIFSKLKLGVLNRFIIFNN